MTGGAGTTQHCARVMLADTCLPHTCPNDGRQVTGSDLQHPAAHLCALAELFSVRLSQLWVDPLAVREGCLTPLLWLIQVDQDGGNLQATEA
jgi:hypothetical protein